MRKSIFEIENRIDINAEFRKFVETLNESCTIYYQHGSMSFFRFLNRYIFNLWDYRDTFIDLADYLKHIGINQRVLDGYQKIGETEFLNFMELLLNLVDVIEKNTQFNRVEYLNVKTKNIIGHNIPLILEKMNYEVYDDEFGRKCIRKRDADVDSVLEIVTDGVASLLLCYNDVRNNNLESKKTILKKLDLHIEENKKEYKGYDSKLYDSIQTVVNKMGVNHPISEMPYSDMTEDEIILWYDKCFKMMLHLIRSRNVNKIKQERDDLVK